MGTSYFNRVEANEFVGATLSGNSFSATKLQTARTINGVSFDGTENITVPANANTLTGTTLASNVIDSNLTRVGTLDNLDVAGATGIILGSQFRLFLDGGVVPTIRDNQGIGVNLDVVDSSVPGGYANVSFISSAVSLSFGG